ncbi:MAG: ASKHA domain-containing protein [Bacteroidia bacterium]|nr:ASKHA domain-containing protein [Bacteroidia bacterium]
MFTKLKIVCAPGESLLHSIREKGAYVHAPCGGKGICGKCKVDVEGIGMTRACGFYPDHEVVVNIPEPSVMQVLTESFWPDPEPDPDIFPTDNPYLLGLAVDLGTTTVVVFLDDLKSHRNIGIKSFPNPQQAYGADVVSRIHYCRENPEGTNRLQKEIVSAIAVAAAGLCNQNGFAPGLAGRMVVTGNPTMLHIFKGVNPESLAVYPFTPVFLKEQNLKGAEIGLIDFSAINIEMVPSVSSYIGADIVGGLASVSFNPPPGWSLFLDIGTNGEMVLWKGSEILACATAAGPAFEGARISCGMAGIEGAVCAIGPGGYETIGMKPATGLCGSGLVDAVALLLDAGKIDVMGYMEGKEELIEGFSISLNPQDIREVQLAKGAIAAGIKVMMHEAGITADDIRQVFMAGGFGYALHDWSAGRIGLIPEGLENRQIRAGNTSGLGARLWLHSEIFRNYTRDLAGRIQYVELSEHQAFNDLFMWEMTFPENSAVHWTSNQF